MMDWLLNEHHGWLLASAALGAVSTWLILVRRVAVQEITTAHRER